MFIWGWSSVYSRSYSLFIKERPLRRENQSTHKLENHLAAVLENLSADFLKMAAMDNEKTRISLGFYNWKLEITKIWTSCSLESPSLKEVSFKIIKESRWSTSSSRKKTNKYTNLNTRPSYLFQGHYLNQLFLIRDLFYPNRFNS